MTKKQLLLILLALLPMIVSAYDFQFDAINYNRIADTETVEVTNGKLYTGDIIIPKSVEWAGRTYIVARIGDNAFLSCKELQSVSISNSVTSIGASAFQNCSNLSSLEIPNSVTDIGIMCFDGTAWLKNQPDGLVYAGKVVYCYKGIIPENVILEEGTVGIAVLAFYYQKGMNSIVIPNTVVTIGSRAFDSCTGLKEIVIPGSVRSIGSQAFMNCEGLSSITIEEGVISIGKGAFIGCSNLTDILIPNSVTNIDEVTFEGTPWYNNQPEGLVYAGKVAYHYKGTMPDNTSVFIKDGTLGVSASAFKYCTGLTAISFPNSLTYIGNSAFEECSGLESVIIPQQVTTIGYSVFKGCTSLSSATIPNSVISIGSATFYGCRKLMFVNIPSNLKSINEYLFSGCTSLTSVIIPNNVVSIGGCAFQGCRSISSLTLGESLNDIDKRAFEECDGLSFVAFKCHNVSNLFSGFTSIKEVSFDKTVTFIGSGAFQDCSKLATITIEEGLQSIASYAFSGCVSLSAVSFPNSLTSIGENAFNGCSSLTTIEIPENVTNIGSKAFFRCIGLTSASISKSVNKIGSGVFAYCENLSSITVDKNNQTYDSRNDCNAIIYTATNTLLSGCKSTIIPASVIVLGYQAFWGCKNLSSITIPKEITKIESNAFEDCSGLNSIVVENENLVYDSRDNCNAIIKTSINELVCGCNSTIIPNGVTTIGYNAFFGCHGLTSIHIPESVTSINDNSFDECIGLFSITIDKKNPKYDSRDDCNAIIETESNRLIVACSSSSIPSSVTSYSQSAFNNCASLSIPDGLQEITSNMFISCDKLVSLRIPSSVKKIAESAFDNCSSLKTVVFEDGQEPIQLAVSYPAYYSKPQWFSACPLDSVYIGRNISYDFTPSGGYGTFFLSPFREKPTLRKVVFGDKVSIIPSAMFSGCVNLVSVVTPEKMDSIGFSAFNGCESLASFALPQGIRTIGNSAFDNCKSLTSINIPETVKIIEEKAFHYCEGLAKISIPMSVNYIGRLAFGLCTSLSDIEFQDGDNSLTIREERGPYFSAFYQCPISKVYLGRNIINDSYNYIYSSLASITTSFDLTISKSVTKLEGGTFANCNSIKSLTFEEGSDTLKLVNDYNAYTAIMPFANTPIDSIYLGRVIVGTDRYYPENTIIPFTNVGSPFSMRIGDNITEIGEKAYSRWMIDSLYIPKDVIKIGNRAFADCQNLKDVTSYAINVPETGEYVFTESYLPDATLNVPLSLYKEYKAKIPWSLFGRIQNFEGKYYVTYIVDGTIYKEVLYEYGAVIIPEAEPTKEGCSFSGWSKIPETMPDHDIVITGTFTLIKKKGDVNGNDMVDISDAMCIVNHILGKEMATFIDAAADVNGDGVIDIADAVHIVNIILNNGGSQAAPALEKTSESMKVE